MMERYQRQMILPEVGEAGQGKLTRSRVLIVGAGGLGSPAALYLAAAGVGHLGILDGDQVSLSNLNRQVLHKTACVGTDKTASAKDCLLERNPEIQVETYPVYLTPENAEELVSQYDFVIDACDNYPAKFLINDACVLQRKPFCYGGVRGFQGQLMTWVPGQGPCLRCIFEEIPQEDPEKGILGPIAGTVGTLQAMEALKYLLGAGALLTGRMFTLDGLTMKPRVIPFGSANPDCRVCGEHPAVICVRENAGEYESLL